MQMKNYQWYWTSIHYNAKNSTEEKFATENYGTKTNSQNAAILYTYRCLVHNLWLKKCATLIVAFIDATLSQDINFKMFATKYIYYCMDFRKHNLYLGKEENFTWNSVMFSQWELFWCLVDGDVILLINLYWILHSMGWCVMAEERKIRLW